MNTLLQGFLNYNKIIRYVILFAVPLLFIVLWDNNHNIMQMLNVKQCLVQK